MDNFKLAAARLEKLVRNPQAFLQPDESLCNSLKNVIKSHFDYAKQAEGQNCDKQQFGPLPELYIEGFDAEQIWEELRLRSVPLLSHVGSATKLLTSLPNKQLYVVKNGKGTEKIISNSSDTSETDGSRKDTSRVKEYGEEEGHTNDPGLEKDTISTRSARAMPRKNNPKDHENSESAESDSDDSQSSVEFGPKIHDVVALVDDSDSVKCNKQRQTQDNFDKVDATLLEELNAFAEQEERREYGDDDIDDDGSGSHEEDEQDDSWRDALFSAESTVGADKLKYADLFGNEPVNAKSTDFMDDGVSNSDAQTENYASDVNIESSVKPKREPKISAFEKGQQRLKNQIAVLEEEAVATKAWSLIGEAKGADR